MIPAYRHSASSIMPTLDLNEDLHNNHHHLFTTTPPPNYQASSSSFSSPSCPLLFNPPDHDHHGSYSWETKPLDEEAGKIIPSSGSSWDHSAAENHEGSIGSKVTTIWKKEVDMGENNHDEDGSLKWMSSKMRIMRKMMVSDHNHHETGSYVAPSSVQKFEDHQKQPLSPLGTDHSSNNYKNQSNNNTVRVCADCHTTKTPLWRSGPTGPKSLCNACGIRQRKARRAMAAAAAAAANGTIVMAGEKSVKGKEKKPKIECAAAAPQMKKKRKLNVAKKPSSTTSTSSSSQSRNKLISFEDLRLRLLSKNVAFKQVFPQDEKEAAILLMALSYGLVHG